MPSSNPDHEEKPVLYGKDLQELARSGSPTEELSVIISPRMGQPKVGLKQTSSGSRGRIQIESLEGNESKEDYERVERVGLLLESFIGTRPRWNKLSRIYVATLNGRQIQELAQSPDISSISVNRKMQC